MFREPERKSSSESRESRVMTSAQVVETSVNVTSNSPSQDYTHPDDHNLPNHDMTPGFKPFTVLLIIIIINYYYYYYYYPRYYYYYCLTYLFYFKSTIF